MNNQCNAMFRCWLLASFSVLLSLSPGIAQGAELGAQRDGVVEKVSISTPEFRSEAATTVYWQKEIQKIGSQYLRLRITQVRGLGDNEIILELRDRSGLWQQSLSKMKELTAHFTSQRIEGEQSSRTYSDAPDNAKPTHAQVGGPFRRPFSEFRRLPGGSGGQGLHPGRLPSGRSGLPGQNLVGRDLL